jgi:hypothetical protein
MNEEMTKAALHGSIQKWTLGFKKSEISDPTEQFS